MVQDILAPLAMSNSGLKFTPEVVNNTAIGFYGNGSVAPLYDTGTISSLFTISRPIEFI